METSTTRYDAALVVSPSGRIDSTTCRGLEEQLERALAGGELRIVVDFAQVDYISSAGLRVMLALARRLRDARGSLVLCALPPPVKQVFELAGFVPLFTMEPTRDAALARLATS
jgi:stage II sporulation protein AA (anti-sigma F factor antagonist)